MNAVCFRYGAETADADRLNTAIVAEGQEAGIGPSGYPPCDRQSCTETVDVDRLVNAVLAAGRSRTAKAA